MEVRRLSTEGVFQGEYDVNTPPMCVECPDEQTTHLFIGPLPALAFRTADLLRAIERESTRAARQKPLEAST